MDNNLLDYKQAQQAVLARVTAGGQERLLLAEATDRVLAHDLVAGWDLPRHDNSAMDGFAIRSDEADVGVKLQIAGTIAAGSEELIEVVPGHAVRIMTGAVMPPGADTVIPVEKVEVEGGLVKLQGQVAKGDHIRWQGEDLQKGELALPAGSKLTAAELGLLATFGHGEIDLFRKPKVALLATGNELLPPGSNLTPSRIFDCNTAALCAAVVEAGGEPVPLGIARDERESLARLITEGLQADILITAAGASVGEFDLVREVLADLKAQEIFWGVAIKPGKPTAFCLCNDKPVFCLPGNPVSALVTFELFVRPALLKMQGCHDVLRKPVLLPLAESMRKKPARTLFARIKLVNTDDGLMVSSAGSQQSGIMTSLVQADGLAILPDGKGEFAKGEKVEVLILKQR